MISAGLLDPDAVPVQSKTPELVAPDDNVTSMNPSVPLHTVGLVPAAAITGERFSVNVTDAVAVHPELSASRIYVPAPTIVGSATGVVPSDS